MREKKKVINFRRASFKGVINLNWEKKKLRSYRTLIYLEDYFL